ncbi:MAG: hypothetical protein GTN76_03705 [Candidatus Aenigmarchaeota archaeon]|nr:hypothetical protein [Candidatus Aenigmarchaeota archaeon]
MDNDRIWEKGYTRASDKPFEVNPKDAALIITAEGDMHLCLPILPEEQDMPAYALLVAAVGKRLTEEPEFVREMMEWFDVNFGKFVDEGGGEREYKH